MKKILISLLFVLLTTNVHAQKENNLNKFHCSNAGGNFSSKFADCEFETTVVEGEYLYSKAKVYEAIGQILYYGSVTDKDMVIWAYMKPGKEDKFLKYYDILVDTIKFHDLQIKVIKK